MLGWQGKGKDKQDNLGQNANFERRTENKIETFNLKVQ